MGLNKLYYFAKMIHRVLVVTMCVVFGVMGGTGAALVYPSLFGAFGQTARVVHRNAATVSLVLFGVMLVTGIVLYIYPWWVRRKSRE